MNENLLMALIEKGVIQQGTELAVEIPGVDLSGAPTLLVEEIVQISQITKNKNTNKIRIHTFSTRDGKPHVIGLEQIKNIDGMEPSKMATAYDLRIDGTAKPQGKRRGRKPKNAQIEV